MAGDDDVLEDEPVYTYKEFSNLKDEFAKKIVLEAGGKAHDLSKSKIFNELSSDKQAHIKEKFNLEIVKLNTDHGGNTRVGAFSEQIIISQQDFMNRIIKEDMQKKPTDPNDPGRLRKPDYGPSR